MIMCHAHHVGVADLGRDKTVDADLCYLGAARAHSTDLGLIFHRAVIDGLESLSRLEATLANEHHVWIEETPDDVALAHHRSRRVEPPPGQQCVESPAG